MNEPAPASPHPNPVPEKGEAAHGVRGLFANFGDDVAYIAPMGVFLLLTGVGVKWPALYVVSYVIKTIGAAILLYAFWPRYTRIRWDYAWLGLAMGVIGVVQWVGMERILLALWPHFPEPGGETRDWLNGFDFRGAAWAFIAIRWAGATLLVPMMEELFWRDFLWRSGAAPADFKLASVGEWDRGIPMIAVSLAFCMVHPQWLTAIVWGLTIGGLLVYTRSLGACIIMHATTNFLLGAYVLCSHDWRFW